MATIGKNAIRSPPNGPPLVDWAKAGLINTIALLASEFAWPALAARQLRPAGGLALELLHWDC
jgi:hypothetical protein